MSEIQKGRPTIYGVDQPKRRSREAREMSATGQIDRKAGSGVRRPVMEAERKRGEYSRTVHQGRRRESGAVHTTEVPGRRKEAGTPVYAEPPRRGAAVPSTRAVRDWEEMPERDEMHRSDFASDRKLRVLWSVFGILAVLLVAAIIYEVVLGNGLKETGNQRMAGQTGTQTTTHTNTQATAQTDAAASTSAADSASTTQTSASTTPDAGTTDAADGANAADSAENDSVDDVADDSADGSADDTVDDIPTIAVEGDGVQADAAE